MSATLRKSPSRAREASSAAGRGAPSYSDAPNLSSRPKGDIYGIDARANRGADDLAPAAAEQAEALS